MELEISPGHKTYIHTYQATVIRKSLEDERKRLEKKTHDDPIYEKIYEILKRINYIKTSAVWMRKWGRFFNRIYLPIHILARFTRL